MNTVLTLKETDKILNDIDKNYFKKNVLTAYRNACSQYKSNVCCGYAGTNGCHICYDNKTTDKMNGMPFPDSREYNEFERESEEVFKNFHKNCPFKSDNKQCRYKDLFNFCIHCDSVFNRQR